MSRRALFIFVDGVGIGPADPELNPFLRAGLPALKTLLGGKIPTLDDPAICGPATAIAPLDAVLGVPGTPQSGTGQTALLTGRNAPRLYGRHFGPWTPVALRPLLEQENLMSAAARAGLRAAFANAYPKWYFERHGFRRSPAPPLAARASGLLNRHADSLRSGEAVASEIVNTGWRGRLGHAEVPDIEPAEAGANLARIAAGEDLTVFAHYSTDLAGHRGGMEGAVRALQVVDEFLGGVVKALPADTLLLLASDHGNIEDVRGGHTTNPALGLIAGPDASAQAQRLRAITDVPQVLMEWLGVPSQQEPRHG
ncbi:MAG: alkaline phosphatase family protein [Gemmatimonadetes bacterium]|nr:alkaline phosphatase family protein [Gemmatimonadota bacterium]